MVKRLSAISIVLAFVLAMAAIPASAAMGGLTAPRHYHPKHHGCRHYLKHGKRHKCGRHCHDCNHPIHPPKPFPETGPPCGCGSSEEPLAVKEVEVFEAVGFKDVSRIYGCAGIYGTDFGPEGDEYSIMFLAEYGSFESKVTGGFKNKYEPSPIFCDRYVKPSPDTMPADGYDEVWVLVLDRTNHTYAESEHVKFNIEEPENIRYPVG